MAFSLGDFATAMMPGFDDGNWREVQVPHDWSVAGPFGPQYGSGNGYAPGGIGWYRKSFDLKTEQQGKRVVVMFDGVYQGRGLAIVQSGFIAGTVQIKAHSEGLEPAHVKLTVR